MEQKLASSIYEVEDRLQLEYMYIWYMPVNIPRLINMTDCKVSVCVCMCAFGCVFILHIMHLCTCVLCTALRCSDAFSRRIHAYTI